MNLQQLQIGQGTGAAKIDARLQQLDRRLALAQHQEKLNLLFQINQLFHRDVIVAHGGHIQRHRGRERASFIDKIGRRVEQLDAQGPGIQIVQRSYFCGRQAAPCWPADIIAQGTHPTLGEAVGQLSRIQWRHGDCAFVSAAQ
ncbi:hypothetical protein [Roseateles sp.]|uniref:hypothetical protein n=1 Tax=Roseateles sp. TaxID=1971397 RepID=UPI003D0E2862